LPNAVLTIISPTRTTTLYSTPLLLLLPFPDASMPFNVIAFTSTMAAFLFGSMFHVLYADEEEIIKRRYETPLDRVKSKLGRLLFCFRKRKSD
jgi:hypothetical protein